MLQLCSDWRWVVIICCFLFCQPVYTDVQTHFTILIQGSEHFNLASGFSNTLTETAGRTLDPPVSFSSVQLDDISSTNFGNLSNLYDFAVLSPLEMACLSLAEGWSPLATTLWSGDGFSTDGKL